MAGNDWETAKLVRITHSQVEADVEDEWNVWYNSEHVPALVAVPGYVGCRRFRRLDEPHKFLSVFDLSDPDAIRTEEYRKAAGNGVYAAKVTSFGPAKTGISYEETFRMTSAEAASGAKAKQRVDGSGPDWPTSRYIRLVHSLVEADVEEEWNEWYNRVHVPALLNVPGYDGCRRFRRIDEPHAYISVFDMSEPDAIHSEEFKRAAGNGIYSEKVRSNGPAAHGITYEETFRLTKAEATG